jgi:tetratricopeptide (TPR) repeat protein
MPARALGLFRPPRLALLAALLAPLWAGCGGHSARTLAFRDALDAGDFPRAVGELNKELDVAKAQDLPAKIEGDNALLVLDRASVQQARREFDLSRRDFQAADKALDVLDLSQNASDTLAKYIFSDDAGRYAAPPYEKLLVNAFNMVNYLELGDLNGARVEARRLSVTRQFLLTKGAKRDSDMFALGAQLAGFALEKSGEVDEALRYYDEALAAGPAPGLDVPIARLLPRGNVKSPRLREAAERGAAAAGAEAPEGEAEVLLVLGYGRVPHKIAKRLPIGLALTYFSGAIRPDDAVAANKLAAQGLVTWINYPSLAPEQGQYADPICAVDGRIIGHGEPVNLSRLVREEWREIEGKIVASAITRAIARVALGQGVETAAGRDNIVGFLVSLGLQAGLSAADTPDTRSWEALPARVVIERVRLPAGRHAFDLRARGVNARKQIDLKPGGWGLVSLMALR